MDTTIEAVERLCHNLIVAHEAGDGDEDLPIAAATLRALAQERDALERVRDEAITRMGEAARNAGSWQGIAEGKDIVIRQIEAERDAARAQVERLREAIKEAIGDLSEHAEPYGRVAIESAHQKLRAAWLAALAAKEGGQ